MHSGLLVKHYSLLAIAIISSCFLFYLVASENAKNAATIHQHKDAADVSPLRPSPFGAAVDVCAAAEKGEIIATDGNERTLQSIKKVKKANPAKERSAFSSSSAFVKRLFSLNEKSDVSVKTDALLSEEFKNPINSDKSVNKNENLDKFIKSDNRDDSEVIQTSAEDAENFFDDATKFDGEKRDPDKLAEKTKSLPNIITDIPAVTVTELPLETLRPMQSSLNAILVDASNKKTNAEDVENRTVDILEGRNEQPSPGDQIIKINDSGGGSTVDCVNNLDSSILPKTVVEPSENEATTENATITTTTTTASPITPEQQQEEEATESTTSENSVTVNLTNEEIPMPVFSEWAQKQMEAAEKQQQAKEQEVVNTIAQKKNLTNGNKKLPPLKMRAKNYASPDCGAKIIASNADATNTGAVLSSSKDEYMLSPCGNRIWFVVELCEAIQAQKVDLANFELFSSSPKNFTVAVSNRFPTRDWSNVGRFIAEDKRTVQSFDLHPHLFGKFVRLDVHSHYSQEHFCPISLFRVFGTSEIEAFETENHPDDDLDDFDDDLLYGEKAIIDQANAKNSDNIFKTASDAVLSIVKKAREVLVKPAATIQNGTENRSNQNAVVRQFCRTYRYGEFNCAKCSANLVERINNIISCEFHRLDSLLALDRLRNDLENTRICSKHFDLVTKAFNKDDCSLHQDQSMSFDFDTKRSYYINLLPVEYIGALCYTISSSQMTGGSEQLTTIANEKDNEMALNLTIDKKLQSTDFKSLNNDEKIMKKPSNIPSKLEAENREDIGIPLVATEATIPVHATTEVNIAESEQILRPPEIKAEDEEEPTTTPMTKTQDDSTLKPTVAPDVNIFNAPSTTHDKKVEIESTEMPSNNKANTDNAEETVTESTIGVSVDSLSRNEEDVGGIVWDNFDTLLPPTTISPGGGNIPQNTLNLQQKLSGSPQSESIFIRLSNRIKALERNMSLSGQYLEELSRRYKKQVEELQQILTQQSQTVRNLEDQNRRHFKLQEMYEQNSLVLKNELDNMALQLHACIVVVIVVGAFVLLLLVVTVLFFRAIWHRSKTKQTMATTIESNRDNGSCNQKKLPRRKSFDDYSSDHGTGKIRRPSEEVTDILKKHLDIPDKHRLGVDKNVQTQPQRKMSVCYSSNSPNRRLLLGQEKTSKTKNSTKRKNAKISWSNPNDTQVALEQLESMRGMDVTLDEYKQMIQDKSQRERVKMSNTNQIGSGNAKPKKKQPNFLRQESAPSQYAIGSGLKNLGNISLQNDYGENPMLDEEDLDNFIPNSDLAYNEFMPDGPSGYQIVMNGSDSIVGGLKFDKGNEKKGKEKEKEKTRRISSPGFFKTSLSKALKGKSLGSGIVNTSIASNIPHSSATSWEWHRLKSKNSNLNTSPSSVELLRRSPTDSLDASTLSEIHFPTNSTENSFRILEEAILSSGEAIDISPTTITSNGNRQSQSNTSSISGGSNSSQHSSISNSTSSSTTTKKKQRSFQRILRKVF